METVHLKGESHISRQDSGRYAILGENLLNVAAYPFADKAGLLIRRN